MELPESRLSLDPSVLTWEIVQFRSEQELVNKEMVLTKAAVLRLPILSYTKHTNSRLRRQNTSQDTSSQGMIRNCNIVSRLTWRT